VRSPTPQNTEKPPFSTAVMRISSWMSTVLPTPAPPNRPILPPLANGQSRSTTLMPVSKTSVIACCSSKVGAGRWIGQRPGRVTRHRLVRGCVDATSSAAEHVEEAALGGVTDRHLDRRAGVDAAMPRLMPSVDDMATQRTDVVAELLRDLEHRSMPRCLSTTVIAL
jgi:hypothetical protein